MPKSVCAKCEVELRPELNGVVVAEMMQNNTKLYKLWRADLWKCPGCGIEVVLGFAQHPVIGDWEGEDLIKKQLEEFKSRGCRIIYDFENVEGSD